jgi:hypothetical protein
MNKNNRVLPAFSQKVQITNGAAGYGKRIIKKFTKNGRDYEYHATKGWRNYRSVGGAAQ